MPPGALPCPGCDRSDVSIYFRGWSRLYAFAWWAKEARYSAYLCRDCLRKQTALSLFMTALLGWWSVPSIFWYGWRSTYYNWRSVWAPPGDPLSWGAMSLADLLGAFSEEAAEAANFANSPISDLTHAERHMVLSVEDPYGVLRVHATATPSEIKAAWRDLAKTTHPDVNPGDPEATARMYALNQAHEILGEPRLRAAYDWLVVNGERVA